MVRKLSVGSACVQARSMFPTCRRQEPSFLNDIAKRLCQTCERLRYGKQGQSWTETGINIGINTIMLRMPFAASVGYAVGSTTYQVQQKAFTTLINNGHGNSSEMFNTDGLK